ncbi:hypothetical protein Salat_2839200 [Sesamum alatum]|uniref:NAC domain-containing protein n=1 Tax=Sesamum alatum TaxID=300844 RepID=A0AAE1XLV1_9LAMI|nr:hypothetical protein Salat_2839200 [Sesamum alatum]
MEEQPLVRRPPEYYNLMICDYERILSEPVPPGMRFLPTDVELVGVYLKHKPVIRSLPRGFGKLFIDVELYQPGLEELIGKSRKYLKGQQPERTAGNGYWKAIEKDTQVVEYTDEIGPWLELVLALLGHPCEGCCGTSGLGPPEKSYKNRREKKRKSLDHVDEEEDHAHQQYTDDGIFENNWNQESTNISSLNHNNFDREVEAFLQAHREVENAGQEQMSLIGLSDNGNDHVIATMKSLGFW